jgi:hypothetical protein
VESIRDKMADEAAEEADVVMLKWPWRRPIPTSSIASLCVIVLSARSFLFHRLGDF